MTKRTQTEPAVCWLASEWTKSLGRVLDERTGQSLRVDRLEPMADAAPAGLEWWAQTPAGKTRPSL